MIDGCIGYVVNTSDVIVFVVVCIIFYEYTCYILSINEYLTRLMVDADPNVVTIVPTEEVVWIAAAATTTDNDDDKDNG